MTPSLAPASPRGPQARPLPRSRDGWRLLAVLMLAGAAASAGAWELAGDKVLRLHSRDGQSVALGHVKFTPRPDGRVDFRLALETERFKDYFLSMREFKCLDGQGEVFCHVPYPYAQPATVTATDLAWLEHALLFLFKSPSEFGAKLWNGVIWQLRLTERGLEGRPQAVDLNQISAPPARLDVPPFKPALRDELPPQARWFNRLTIE